MLLWATFLSFPLPFIATLTGWFTAEVGRQPWTIYGVLRTADAMTPFLSAREATISLVVFCAVYLFIFAFGTFYVYRLLLAGPVGNLDTPARRGGPHPADVGRTTRRHCPGPSDRWRIAMIDFWVAILAVSVLLYVLLDGFDLGVGMLFGCARDAARRDAMLGAVAPVWDGNETWLVVTGVVLWGAFPPVYATLLSAFYLPLLAMLAGLILRGVAFEFRHQAQRGRVIWDWSFAAGSFIATFIQGTAVGALVEGLPIRNGQYVGGDFGWSSPFALLCGAGLCLGYALLGASWLVRKCDGDVRDTAYRQIPYLAVGVLVFLIAVFIYALARRLSDHATLVGAALSVRVPCDRSAGGDRAGPQRSQSPRFLAVPHGRARLRFGVRNARHLVLALYDTRRDHDPRGGGAAIEFGFHVLGRGHRLPAHVALHGHQLCRIRRQADDTGRTLLIVRRSDPNQKRSTKVV